MKIHITLLLLGAGLLLSLRPAAAESNHCTPISALPITLSSAGVYCLTQDLVLAGTGGVAVFINADSVTLDLNGHALRSNAAGNMSTFGVSVVGQKYFTITDGTIVGFAQAVYVGPAGSTPAKSGLISNLKVQRTYTIGISALCDGCVVRDNMVTETNIPASFGGNAAIGIGVSGTGNQVIGNRVFNTFSQPGDPAFGISVSGSNSNIANNYSVNDHIGSDATYGYSIIGANALLSANQAQGMSIGYNLTATNLKYRDNLSGGCTYAFNGASVGGTHDLGGNN